MRNKVKKEWTDHDVRELKIISAIWLGMIIITIAIFTDFI